ncbi:MAG: septal ring lytic transglycosylase RlpA family protein [Cytophagaceae bacterium]|nr:septal ring lytic transglycosylase RlpA family protein [Cytophagaceae bacterium]
MYYFKNLTIKILIFASFVCLNCFSSFAQKVDIGKEYKGTASYYSLKFSGRKTASGERLNNKEYTCAHRYLPFGTMLEVENPKTGKWVIVRVNDRGPFSKGRIVDLSFAAAKEIGMIQKGVISVNAKVVGKNGEIMLAREGATESNFNDIYSKDSSNDLNLQLVKDQANKQKK